MKNFKEVQLIKKSNGEHCFVAIDEFFEKENYTREVPKLCEVITNEPFGWWIHEKTNKGGASDGIGDEIIVRDFSDADFESILKNGGKCFVEVDYNNKLKAPKNGRGDGKVVFFLENK